MELSLLIDAPADYVLIANPFHGVLDKTALAREIAAILGPAGHYAIVNRHCIPRCEETSVLGHPRGPRTELRMSSEQTRAVVEPAGFQLETVVEQPPFHYAAIFR